MKRILPLLLILAALAACTGSMRHGKALQEAEALLGSRPETALRMLDSIGREGDGMGKAERMRLLQKGKRKELARIKEAILADDTFKRINELLDNDTRPMKKWTQKDFLPAGIYEEMEQVFQREFPAFGEILHTSGKISQLEFVNCMLVWLGYKAYDICKICCQLPSANSMMRKRLYTKIAGKSGNGKNLEELLQIITPY